MAKLICVAITSLDGYIEHAEGKLDERRFRNGTVYLHYRTRG